MIPQTSHNVLTANSFTLFIPDVSLFSFILFNPLLECHSIQPARIMRAQLSMHSLCRCGWENNSERSTAQPCSTFLWKWISFTWSAVTQPSWKLAALATTLHSASDAAGVPSAAPLIMCFVRPCRTPPLHFLNPWAQPRPSAQEVLEKPVSKHRIMSPRRTGGSTEPETRLQLFKDNSKPFTAVNKSHAHFCFLHFGADAAHTTRHNTHTKKEKTWL